MAYPDSLDVFAPHNLLANASLLVERGLGCAICVRGAYAIRENDKARFIPFYPERRTGHVLAYKKNRIFTSATSLFIQFIKNAI
ncbi:MAG: hypothetical protein LBU32_19455 [Clostridiales bacterium]|nr:hypothetical protein [Clostridiales bacterium]